MNSATTYQTMFTSPVLVAIGCVGVYRGEPSDTAIEEAKTAWTYSNKTLCDMFKQRVLSRVSGRYQRRADDDVATMPISIECLMFEASYRPPITMWRPSPEDVQPPGRIICSTISIMQYTYVMTVLVQESVLRAYQLYTYIDNGDNGDNDRLYGMHQRPLDSIPPLMQSYAEAQYVKLLSKWLSPDIVKYIGSFLYVDPVVAACTAIKQRGALVREISYDCIVWDDHRTLKKNIETGVYEGLKFDLPEQTVLETVE